MNQFIHLPYNSLPHSIRTPFGLSSYIEGCIFYIRVTLSLSCLELPCYIQYNFLLLFLQLNQHIKHTGYDHRLHGTSQHLLYIHGIITIKIRHFLGLFFHIVSTKFLLKLGLTNL